VSAAVVGFGAPFSYPVIQATAERLAPDRLPAAYDTILAISRRVAVPAAAVVGATGVYQAADGPYSLARDGWLLAGVILYLAVMAVATAYLVPRYRRARAAAASGPDSAEYRAARRGITVVGPAVAAAIVATVVLMEVKPG
jgi:uncharacterized membrane protein